MLASREILKIRVYFKFTGLQCFFSCTRRCLFPFRIHSQGASPRKVSIPILLEPEQMITFSLRPQPDESVVRACLKLSG